jgi:hypothetical protein
MKAGGFEPYDIRNPGPDLVHAHICGESRDRHTYVANQVNNKITELRTILRRESQNSSILTDKISQQPENCEKCTKSGPGFLMSYGLVLSYVQ